jgi:hypothetical protein
MNQDAPEDAYYNSRLTGLFLQDNLKLHPRLTANLGLRRGCSEATDGSTESGTDIRSGSTIHGASEGAAGSAFRWRQGRGARSRAGSLESRIFAGRFGLGPFGNGKTAIRAGAEIFFGSVSGNGWGTVENSQPFAVRQQFSNPASLSNPYANLPGGVSPFPYVYSLATARFVTPAGLLPIALDFRWPYSYQLNLTVQRK